MDPVILKSRHVRQDEGARGRRGQAGGEACDEPVVRTLVDRGVVRAIEIVCACGETVTVQLDCAESPRQDNTGANA